MNNKREATEARLITAMGEVLAEKGFAKVGVNVVARQAGVDKVLIYRYFKDLGGLMTAYAQSADFWPPVSEILGEGESYDALRAKPFSEVIAEVFRRYAYALRSRPLTLEILSWETVERNALTIASEEVRETMGLALMEHLKVVDAPEADWLAIANIFSGAIHYLAIRARKINTFTGMDLSGEQGWDRLIESIEFLVRGIEKSAYGATSAVTNK